MKFTNSSLATYCNFTNKNYGPRTSRIERITIHCVVGQCTAKNCVDYFKYNDVESSSNYVVGKDGDIAQCVDEGRGAWTSSDKTNDMLAVTIETASDTFEPFAVTDKAYEGLLKLVTDICKRNGIKKLLWISDKNKALAYKVKDGEAILSVHRWFANKSCPGDYLYNRMGEIASTVTKRLGDEDSAPPTVVNKYPSVPFLVRVLIDDLNIRKSPCVGDNLTGKYTGKNVFTIVEVNGDWGKLKSGAGWIYLANTTYVTILDVISEDDDDYVTKKPQYFIQVGVYNDKGNAEAMAKRLRAAGFSAIIKEK